MHHAGVQLDLAEQVGPAAAPDGAHGGIGLDQLDAGLDRVQRILAVCQVPRGGGRADRAFVVGEQDHFYAPLGFSGFLGSPTHHAPKEARHEPGRLSARNPGARLAQQVGLPWRPGLGHDRAAAQCRVGSAGWAVPGGWRGAADASRCGHVQP